MLVLFHQSILLSKNALRKESFLSWPGINDLNFKKLISTPEATIKGHLDQERANLQSTQIRKSSTSDNDTQTSGDSDDDAFPNQIDHKTRNCFYIIFDPAKDAKTYMDLTGCFPISKHTR